MPSSAPQVGKDFESEIAQLLRAHDFRVHPNPGIARPRQTDLLASVEGTDFLIEAKHRKKKVDVGDIDALRSRLGRTSADVVGLLFTTSDLTRPAVRAVEADRTRLILPVSGNELRLVQSGAIGLRKLLERKRYHLKVNGKSWTATAPTLEHLAVQLPRSNLEIRIGQGVVSAVESRTDHAELFLALETPDPGWGNSYGDAALLSLDLSFEHVEDLRDVLGFLHERFSLTENGSFAIHQTGASWYGFGADNFIENLRAWKHRYSQSRATRFHNSESGVYFDRFRDGWVLLSIQQVVNQHDGKRGGRLRLAELSIQIGGIPVNTAPFVELCRYAGNEYAQFQYVSERLTHHHRLREKITLETYGLITKTHQDRQYGRDCFVVGVVAKNPLFKKRRLPTEWEPDESTGRLASLLQQETLICSMRDWHDVGDIVGSYELEGFEVVETNRALIVRPFGTWDKLLKSRRNGRDTESE